MRTIAITVIGLALVLSGCSLSLSADQLTDIGKAYDKAFNDGKVAMMRTVMEDLPYLCRMMNYPSDLPPAPHDL